ncbi:MAG TPA: hypothetical protein DCS63_05975 [Elusimicrobia bacterium]|nr:hypothetical protein [Elusimicrobiota bacterium]
MNTENQIPESMTRLDVPAAVLRLLAGEPPGRLLDAPCGRGYLSRKLADAGFSVSALDLDGEGFRAEGIDFTAGDLNEKLPYGGASFDYVLSVEGIEHLRGTAAPVAEFARVLKPGGLLVLTTPNTNSALSRLKFLLFGSFCYFDSRAGSSGEAWMAQHLNPVWVPGLEAALERNGLRVETLAAEKERFGLLARGAASLAGAFSGLFNKAHNPRLQSPELLFGEHLILSARKAA